MSIILNVGYIVVSAFVLYALIRYALSKEEEWHECNDHNENKYLSAESDSLSSVIKEGFKDLSKEK